MDSDRELEAVRYSAMRWNTPLSEAHADELIADLDAGSARSVLDLGCGWAELLIRVLQSSDGQCTGIGVDTDGALLARAATSIACLGLQERISLERRSVAEWSKPADRIICIGASHAWGGSVSALQALSALVAPGGRLLFGDGCWEREPTPEALAIFGEDVLPLSELIEHALDAGWRVLSFSTADPREWDEFECSWRRGREQWLLAHRGSPDAREIEEQLNGRLREYVSGYRGILGFCYLVLTR
jgi:cyclopropane fatty-acyl-phospholipid synthase-like methyltransferase